MILAPLGSSFFYIKIRVILNLEQMPDLAEFDYFIINSHVILVIKWTSLKNTLCIFKVKRRQRKP